MGILSISSRENHWHVGKSSGWLVVCQWFYPCTLIVYLGMYIGCTRNMLKLLYFPDGIEETENPIRQNGKHFVHLFLSDPFQMPRMSQASEEHSNIERAHKVTQLHKSLKITLCVSLLGISLEDDVYLMLTDAPPDQNSNRCILTWSDVVQSIV